MNKILIFFAGIAFILTSCDVKDEYVVEKSKVVEAAGEWYVTYSIGGADINGGLSAMVTYNTAADVADEMWLDDQGNFWTYRVKIPVDINNLTFGSADSVANDAYESQVIVQNGKIMKKVALLPSGALADSIYFEVRFSDDGYYDDDDNFVATPYETVFQVSGFRRTGFLEDEP